MLYFGDGFVYVYRQGRRTLLEKASAFSKANLTRALPLIFGYTFSIVLSVPKAAEIAAPAPMAA